MDIDTEEKVSSMNLFLNLINPDLSGAAAALEAWMRIILYFIKNFIKCSVADPDPDDPRLFSHPDLYII